MRYVFIINPVAGKGKGETVLVPLIENYFKTSPYEYKIYVTEKRSDTALYAKREAEKNDEVTIFACGGEGTAFDIVNSIVDYPLVTLGVLPCGSANDFLKFFGEKSHFLDLDAQINGESIKIDLIHADKYYCINACSVGMDAVVADDMTIFKRWPLVSGSLAYKLSVVRNFLRKIGSNIEISLDGKSIGVRNSLFAVIANGPIYGGSFVSAPEAVPFDGKLNYTLVDTVSKFKIPKFLKHYSAGTQKTLDYCELGICESMEISSTDGKEMPVNLDGEIIHLNKVRFEIAKAKLNFLLPKTINIGPSQNI